ncbi:MAG: uracil-DNA glycosylase [Hyphomicrobiales bacterium]
MIHIIDELSNSLRALADSGIRRCDCSAASLDTMDSWGRANPRPGAGESLADIRTDLGECTRCQLSRSRTRIVFGHGNPRARLMLVGEGPGQEEDLAGEPFVGAAGQLLTRIIEAIKLRREEVYIANVVKCRPPGNRLPEPLEIATCSPFLRRQIASVRPLFICTLGACAAQTLLGTQEPISRLRGRFFDYGGIRVLPTFHPAYLLRNPEKKREVWEDMKALMKEFPYGG